MRKFLIMLMVVAMASFLFVGCIPIIPDPDDPVDPDGPGLYLTGIVVDPKIMDLFEGEPVKIIGEISVAACYVTRGEYEFAIDPADCTYGTSNSEVAKVEKVGEVVTVTGVEAGYADIIVSYEDKFDTIALTVKPVLVTSIAVQPGTMDSFVVAFIGSVVGEKWTISGVTPATAIAIDTVYAYYNYGPWDPDVDLEECIISYGDSGIVVVDSAASVVKVEDNFPYAVGHTFGATIPGNELHETTITVIYGDKTDTIDVEVTVTFGPDA